MSLFLTLQSVQTLSNPKVIDRIKKELFGATTITEKIILEGGLIVVDDGSGSGAAVGANDVSLTVFETTNHYYYDRTSYTNFATSSECSALKANAEQHNITIDNLSTAFMEEEKVEPRRSKPSSEIQKLAKILPTYLDMSGFLHQKVRTDWSTIEAYQDKIGNLFYVEYVEGIVQQPIGILDYSIFITTYTEYLRDELQVSNNGLDTVLLRKRYATLLWKYGEAKAQKPYSGDIKDPRRSKLNSIAPDEEQLVHIEYIFIA
ncbi:hypothetical protein BC332_31691 [Capsicum chinense]|nr:hypothetical protein BC332_31691 [Capsicum chinense]